MPANFERYPAFPSWEFRPFSVPRIGLKASSGSGALMQDLDIAWTADPGGSTSFPETNLDLANASEESS